MHDYDFLIMLANERRDRSGSALRAHQARQSLRGPRRSLFHRRKRRNDG